jgi:DNA (cytosine-5)-methyltransferase 1
MRGLVIDNFAGGGGASTGIEMGMRRMVDIAINHDEAAIAVHKANHPGTRHFCQSVWDVLPAEVVQGHPVDLAWFSPDCKHFSKAKGGKPVEKKIRDLAWVVVRWAECLPDDQKPKVICLENVEEFQDWGPLIETERGLMPCPDGKGLEFQRWIKALKRAGYSRIQWRELRACDYGAPTIRKRLFLIARRDGRPIVWPKPTHGDPKSKAVRMGHLLPWRTAAECIDWSIPCPSIFGRKKPLKDATCRRIAAGIMRYVVNAKRPFIVPLTHHGSADRLIDLEAPMPTVTGAHRGETALVEPILVPHITKFRNNSVGSGCDEPMHTVTANSFIKKSGGAAPLGVVTATLESAHLMTMRNSGKPWQGADEPTHTITAEGAHQYVVAASLIGCGGRAGQSRPRGLDEPTATTTAKADVCVAEATLQPAEHVAAFLAQHNGGWENRSGRDLGVPMSTILQSGSQQQVVTSNLVKLYGTAKDGQPVDAPMPTVTAGGMHVAEVRAFLIKYYGNEIDGHGIEDPIGTVTTRERFGLVTVTIDGEEYVIVDIGMRMLTPRELARAQGFPETYILDPICEYTTDSGAKKTGRLPKSHQIAKIGNSVCPVMAEVLTSANDPTLDEDERWAAE